ncbi:U1 small nuclear ribonucleoprotein-like protein 1 [Elsinoe australis]|uniref:U1 small nuclear ribonucleoprotein-like protein 1 n=1 Tax=Elsinoe australis TaxID=40998 RepID=A0A4U7AWG3_9PEZI|nr:U1 small nuclear ribonucleoprotein-like protein 1 [Elsinoe australis]
MTDKLPPNLLQLFQARPALRYLPPSDIAPEKRNTGPVDGIASFLPALQEEPAPYEPTESWLQRKDRERLEKQEAAQSLVSEDIKDYKPHEDPNATSDPLKTLFVGHLSYKVTEEDISHSFRSFGRIRNIRIVPNDYDTTEGKKKRPHRGYAFIEFEDERALKDAYKQADGIEVKGRKIVVDVERGRTVKGWRPRRYGGGLGGRNYTKEAPPRSFGAPAGPGGFRGGGRGGFRGGRFNDRGGGGGGYRGGGDRFGGGGGRFSGGAPQGAPSGPRGGGGGGGGGGGYGGYGGGGGGRYDRYDSGGRSGSNREPLGGGDRGGGGGGYRDRDNRPRGYDGSGGYDESRSRRDYRQ